jgi:hypothetical protein
VFFFKYRNINAFVGISWNIEIEMHGVTVKKKPVKIALIN